MNNNLLFNEKFIDTRLPKDLSDEQIQNFNNYQQQELYRNKILNNENKIYNPSNLIEPPDLVDNSVSSTSSKPAYFSKEKTSILVINSKNRNKLQYPNNNNFTFVLPKIFKNVIRISLKSTEIPNSDQVIKETPVSIQNNLLTWENEEDIDLGIRHNVIIETVIPNSINLSIPNHNLNNIKRSGRLSVRIFNSNSTPNIDGSYYASIIDDDNLQIRMDNGIAVQSTCSCDLGVPNYTVALEPGNYTISTISSEIEKQMNLVKRRNGSGIYHYFKVTPNLDTNVLSFHSVIISQLSTNPLATTAGTGIITVTQTSHGLKTNDIILITGVIQIAGIPSSVLNGDFTVSVLDYNTFTYEVNVKANSTINGGGTTVKVGKPAPFRFLFNTSKSLIVNNIGFPDEDSGIYINDQTIGPFSTLTYNISDATVDIINKKLILTTSTPHVLQPATSIDILSISTGHAPIITTSSPHRLGINNIITISNSDAIATLNLFGTFSGTFYATVIGLNKLQLSADINIIRAGTTGKIKYGGDKIQINGLQTTPLLTQKSDAIFIIDSITSNTITIDSDVYSITTNSIASTIIGTNHLYVNHPNHPFNEITSIVNGSSSGIVLITTLLPHNLSGKLYSGVSIETIVSNTIDVILINHGLSTSDTIKIFNSTSNPTIDANYFIQVIDNNTVRINYIGGIPSLATANVYIGNTIILSSTNSIPSVDIDNNGNVLYNVNVIDQYNFEIYTGLIINTPGSYGVINRNNNVVFYRTEPDESNGTTVGGISVNSINSVYRPIAKIIDSNNYMVRIVDSYSKSMVSNAGGTSIRTSSNKNGHRMYQLNTSDGTSNTKLYKSINLSGENSIFLIIPGLDTVLYPSSIPLGDIFAKIQLNQPPGNMLYDGFVSAPKIFDQPLGALTSFNIKMSREDGNLFNFNNLDFTLSFEITELVSFLIDSNENSNVKVVPDYYTITGGKSSNIQTSNLQYTDKATSANVSASTSTGYVSGPTIRSA